MMTPENVLRFAPPSLAVGSWAILLPGGGGNNSAIAILDISSVKH
jgi:hypothetical protein